MLVALTGPGVVVAADAASYAVSVLALSLSGCPPHGPSPRRGTLRPGIPVRRTLWRDMAEGWAEFRSRTWLWAMTVQFAFFNLITWAPWMLLGPVMGRAYLGGAAVWGAIMAVQGAGAIAAGLLSLGRRPRRPMVVATIGTFCYALPDVPMALHASAVWVAAAAFCCGAGSAVFGTFYGTALQQQVPPELLARVSALSIFPAYGVGVIGYAIDGPLAAAFGPAAIFGVGAVYGLLSSAAVLTLRSVRQRHLGGQRDRTTRKCLRAAPRSAAKAASLAATVITTATGRTCGRSAAGVNATRPNATATPPTARASAAATRGAAASGGPAGAPRAAAAARSRRSRPR